MQWAEKDDPKLRVHEWGGAHCCRNIEQYISPDCYQTIQLTTEGPSLLFGTAEHPENLFRIILGKPRWELIFFPKYEDAWSSISMDLKKILAMQKSYFSFHLSTQSHALLMHIRSGPRSDPYRPFFLMEGCCSTSVPLKPNTFIYWKRDYVTPYAPKFPNPSNCKETNISR